MTISKFLRNPVVESVLRLIPDKIYLSLMYRKNFGQNINWDNPTTFSEKLQWLKLNDRSPEYSMMVDKYAVKEYVVNKIGDEYVIPTIGVWEKPEDIDFEKLPNQFVLKWNHDSGSIVICKDKNTFDFQTAIKKLKYGSKVNGFWYGREWPYKCVKPCIITENYISHENGELKDYKFFCFDGDPKIMFIASDRFSEEEETKFDFYDMDFNHLPFTNGHPNSLRTIEKPGEFDEMKNLASKLSQGIPHVRVDFYDVNGRVYFGEMTFFHWSGMVPFVPSEWDRRIGEMLVLPLKKKK